MARPLRIEFPGAFYHVMARGNEKRVIYKSHRDRMKFLEYLESASTRYGAVAHSYCLMDNHYHLLLETPDGNLAQIMRHINGSYSTYFNTIHSRVGHLFQGRYNSILVDVDVYCLELSRYIHLNPVKNGLSPFPEEYEWSSYRQYLSEQDRSHWLRTDFVLSLIGDGPEIRKRYQKYVEEDDEIFNEFYREKSSSMAILGRQEFVDEVRKNNPSTRMFSRDLPAVKAFNRKPEVKDIVEIVSNSLSSDHRLAKKVSIYICHHFSGCSLKEIGEHFGVGESAVSENSNRFAMTLYRDQLLAETVAGVLAELKI
jgi:REP element-mobilizing transposase RayT